MVDRVWAMSEGRRDPQNQLSRKCNGAENCVDCGKLSSIVCLQSGSESARLQCDR